MKSAFAGSGFPPFLAAVERVEASLRRRFAEDGKLAEIGRVVGVDPGKITGLSVFWFWRKSGKVAAWAETLITHDEHQQKRDVIALVQLLAGNGMVDVVIEDFIVHSVKKEKSFLSPVRIGRAVEFALLEKVRGAELFFPVHVYMVPPSEMSSMDDQRLKVLGYFTPGPDHRRDATRHTLIHLRRIRSDSSISVVDPNSSSAAMMRVSLDYWKSQNKRLVFPKVHKRAAEARGEDVHIRVTIS
jgi:hypothetical protein